MANPWEMDWGNGSQSTSPVYGPPPTPPKPKDPLDIEGTQLEIQKKKLDIAKAEREAATTGGGTGEQGTAAGFYGRALYANQKYGSGVAPRDPLTQGVVDILPTGVANAFTGKERQLADTYARDFVAATLRKESGAAISNEEYHNQYVRYFPQPGDSTETIAAKARLRDTAIQALRNQAGPASTSAEQSVQQMLQQDANTPTEGGFGLKEDHSNELTPEQQLADRAFLASNPHATAEQYNAFLEHLTGRPMDVAGNAARLKAAQAGGSYSGKIGEDPRVQPMVDQMMREGGGAGAAAIAGAADTAGLGFADEFGAGVNALGQSLSGNGSFGDNYNLNLQANRGYQRALQGVGHGLPYFGGQVVGGFALPMGEVSGAGDLAKLAAMYGGGYGVGSGTDAQSRIMGGLEGAAAGGATGYGIGRLSGLVRPNAGQVPPLVDPASGGLNEPLEAMTPGGRVATAKQFGIDLPLGAATDRGGAIIEKGLDNLPGSAGVMNDARRTVEGQVQDAVGNVADQFGSARTLNEAGSELQRGANEYKDRAQAVIGKAYNAIPIADTAPASSNNTVSTLQQLTGRFQSNPDLAAEMGDPRLQRYLEAIQKGGLSWKDTKDFRSIIGEKIGEQVVGESSSKSDLRALYAALSEDMRNTAQAQGPGALKAFERANNLNREHQQLVEGALTRILGKANDKSPEAAAAAVQAMTKGGKASGDLKTLAQIKAATVKSGAWDEVASAMIRIGGQPANSPGRAFDPKVFVQWYSDMSEPARALLFKAELRKSLDQFVAVNQRLAGSNALRNTSQTVPNFVGTGFAGAAGAATIMGHGGTLLSLAAGAVGNYGMAKLWTNPKFVGLATGLSKAMASGNQNAVRSQIGRIGKLAATNPELREPLVMLQQKLLSAVNDNAMIGAAASDTNTEAQ